MQACILKQTRKVYYIKSLNNMSRIYGNKVNNISEQYFIYGMLNPFKHTKI